MCVTCWSHLGLKEGRKGGSGLVHAASRLGLVPRVPVLALLGVLDADTSPDVLTSLGLSVLVGLSHLRQLSSYLVIKDPAHSSPPASKAWRPWGR